MTRPLTETLKFLRLLPQALVVMLVISAPVLAVPALRAADQARSSKPRPRRRPAPASCCWSACSGRNQAAGTAERNMEGCRFLRQPLPSVTKAHYNGSWKSEFTPNPSNRSSRPSLSRGKASPTPARPSPRCRRSTTATPSSCATPSSRSAQGGDPNKRYRAFYPEVGVTTSSFSQIDSRQAYGHMPTPGHFSTTITRPDLFESYLDRAAPADHAQPRRAGRRCRNRRRRSRCISPSSKAPMSTGAIADRIKRPIRDLFDVPDLDGTDDQIANGTFEAGARRAAPAGAVHRAAHRLFAAPAVALHRDQPAAFPELRAVHQLPVLHRRVLPSMRAS